MATPAEKRTRVPKVPYTPIPLPWNGPLLVVKSSAEKGLSHNAAVAEFMTKTPTAEDFTTKTGINFPDNPLDKDAMVVVMPPLHNIPTAEAKRSTAVRHIAGKWIGRLLAGMSTILSRMKANNQWESRGGQKTKSGEKLGSVGAVQKRANCDHSETYALSDKIAPKLRQIPETAGAAKPHGIGSPHQAASWRRGNFDGRKPAKFAAKISKMKGPHKYYLYGALPGTVYLVLDTR
ncbi:hypothetical protein Bbelb_318090 [Branchiostoma belcheri]|nr:hypothetical protein Bbelb_318090 [Branchiostoma belcheri]